MTDLTCPTCGHPVKVVGAREGTQHYEPDENPVPVEVQRIAAALLDPLVGTIVTKLLADHGYRLTIEEEREHKDRLA